MREREEIFRSQVGAIRQTSRRPWITTVGSIQVGLANIRERGNSSAKTSHPNRGTDLHRITVADGPEHASTSGRRGARKCRKQSQFTASASPQYAASVSSFLAKRLAQPWVDWLIHAFGSTNNWNPVARQFARAFTTGTGIDMPDVEAGCILLSGITLASRRCGSDQECEVVGSRGIVDPRHWLRGQGRLLAPAARAQTQLLRLPMRRSFNSAVSWRAIRVPRPSSRPSAGLVICLRFRSNGSDTAPGHSTKAQIPLQLIHGLRTLWLQM